MLTLEIAVVAKNSHRVLTVISLAVAGVICATLGFEAVAWLANRFPSHDATIRNIGIWFVTILVCVAFLYPMMAVYGLARPLSGSWQRLKRNRNSQ